jgi:hypothetical protein
MKIAKQAHCLIESSLVIPKALHRAHDLKGLMYGVITNKQKPFVIYEWISQFHVVTIPKLCMGRGIGKCELQPTRHSI